MVDKKSETPVRFDQSQRSDEKGSFKDIALRAAKSLEERPVSLRGPYRRSDESIQRVLKKISA